MRNEKFFFIKGVILTFIFMILVALIPAGLVYLITGAADFLKPYQIPLTILTVASIVQIRLFGVKYNIDGIEYEAKGPNVLFWTTLYILIFAYPFPFAEMKYKLIEFACLLVPLILIYVKQEREKKQFFKRVENARKSVFERDAEILDAVITKAAEDATK